MVMSGRRLVIYPYVFSFILISIRRNLGVQVVETGKWPVGKLMGATALNSLFGWWGFPFGIIISVINLFYLWNGGRDLTKVWLMEMVGRKEAKRIFSIAPKPELPPLIWLVRLIALIPLLAVISVITFIVMTNGKL